MNERDQSAAAVPPHSVAPDMRRVSFGRHFEMHPVVFPAAAFIVLAFIGATLGFIAAGFDVESVFSRARDWIGATFGWLYIGSLTAMIGLAAWLALGRFGRVRLGADHEKPEFSRPAWFAMLFSAGMGVGLMFWGVAEPAYHMASLKDRTLPAHRTPGFGDTGRALGTTIFHWGLHPWALYAIVGLALAYFGFRLQMPLSFRSIMHPLFGDRVWGRLGDAIDILAVVATLCGVAASLGMGAVQVNAGLAFLFGAPINEIFQVALIIGITAIATVSVVLGLGKGIRRLSEANMILAFLLLVVVLVTGGIVAFANSGTRAVGGYASLLPFLSFRLFESDDSAQGWVTTWTVLYWAWWIAWSPFVGMFIARISRGRTVREFITCVIIVPTLVTIVWFSAFGGSTLGQQLEHERATASDAEYVPSEALPVYNVIVTDPTGNALRGESGAFVTRDQGLTAVEYLNSPIATEDGQARLRTLPTVLFALLEGLLPAGPLLWTAAGIATLCVVLFFVTSSDSASMVIDIIASGGNPNPPVGTRLFWAVTEGLVAAGILLAGGIQALQAASLLAALPFVLVLILACAALVRALYKYEAPRKA